MHKTSVVAEAHGELNTKRITDFVSVFHNTRVEHKEGIVYTLTQEGEEEYNAMVDSYADCLRTKYDSDSCRYLAIKNINI